MTDNGNPPLLFEPLNDTDDYTVACPINEEFAFSNMMAGRKKADKTAGIGF